MLTVRNTGESLSYQPNMITSNEIRSDRMNADPILVGQTNGGAVNIEFHYPVQNSGLDYFIASAMVAAWTNTPTRDNDGTADSVITDVAATTGVMTVSSTGGTFVVGHLIRNSNFTNSGNNGLFRITTGSATAPAVGASIFTNETAPPATARIKVVGFQGASGDITATATGLGSTTLDFTTLGIVAGQWLKISAEGGAYSFATAALADWVRVTAITATALTFDNRPSGWTTDSGTSDRLENQNTVVSPDSVLPMVRSRIEIQAVQNAAPSPVRMPSGGICPLPGCVTISTPMKPTPTAVQRRQPTGSPRSRKISRFWVRRSGWAGASDSTCP
jgi:hypothetical protein